MTESPSFVYFAFLGENINRLSYGENHPERAAFYGKLEKLRSKGVRIRDLESIVTLVEETVNTSKQFPDQEFDYMGLEDIESNTGRARFRKLYGREILSTCRRLKRGNIVFARLRPYLNKVHLVENAEGVGSGELFVVQPNREDVVPLFLLRFLLSGTVLTQTKWILTGCSYPRLDIEDFRHLKIILPEKSIQDNLLVNLDKLAEDEEKAEKEIGRLGDKIGNLALFTLGINSSSVPHFPPETDCFAQWVNEDRLDLVWNHPTSNSIRKLLDQKNAVPLSTLLETDFEYGLNASGKELGKIPFVNVENLGLDGEICTEGIHYVDEAPDDKILRKDDLLISRSRTVGTAALVSEKEAGFTFGSYVLRFRIKRSLAEPLYLVNYINSSLGQAQITYLQAGSRGVERGGGNNINPTRLKQLRVILPQSESVREEFLTELGRLRIQRGEMKTELVEKVVTYDKVFQDSLLNHSDKLSL